MRYLYNLTAHMPRDSAIARTVNPSSAWTDGEHLLALLAEEIDQTNHLMLRAHFELRGAEPPPLRISRPGQPATPEPEDTRPAHLSSPEAVHKFFTEFNDG